MTEVFQSMRALSKTINRNILSIYKEMSKDERKVEAVSALRLNLDVLLKEFRSERKGKKKDDANDNHSEA